MLHLGQVKVWPEALLDELFSVVEEVETEIKDGARDAFAVDSHVGLVEVPSTSAHELDSSLALQLVLFA